MSTMAAWRQRRKVTRNRRALDRAIHNAHSPAMREELWTLANSGDQRFR